MWYIPLVLVFLSSAHSLDNGLALTPPMGWLTWERFRCTTDCDKYPRECISENLIKRTADLMVRGGYLAAGYQYTIIDSCWVAKRRDRNGRLVPNPTRFPNGMRAVANYVHHKGLKFGLYQKLGNDTCEGYPALPAHDKLNVQTLVDWDIDYFKLSACGLDDSYLEEAYESIGRLLNGTGRQVLYACSWASYPERNRIHPNYATIKKTCNTVRNWLDINDSWASVTGIMDWYGDNQGRFAKFAGPGFWNDPDQLIIGDFGLSVDQARVQMSVWSVMAAPLIMSVDLATIRPEFKKILLNKAVIAVDQDPLGKQGLRIWKNNCSDEEERGALEIWKRELCSGSYALAFVNRGDYGAPRAANFTRSEMKLPSNTYTVTDLFNEDPDQTYGPDCNFEVRINPTGVKFYKFTPKQAARGESARRVIG